MTIDLDELERLARAAWPGGWRAEYMRVELPDVDREPWEPVECPDEDTAAYIAAMNPAVALEVVG